MDFVVSLLLQTALVPIAVSAVVMLTIIRIPRIAAASGAISLAAGFFSGWAMQEWTTLRPTRYLDWLPWVAAALSLIPLASAFGLPRKLTIGVTTAACFGAAWFLVPRFPSLEPAWPFVATVATASLLIVVGLEKPSQVINSQFFTICLMATGAAGAIVLAQSFAMKFAQIVGMLTAALAGSLLLGSRSKESRTDGLPRVFAILLTNLMFVGFVSSSSKVPAYSYALVAIAPLSLLTIKRDPTTETPSRKSLLVGMAALAVLLLLAVGPAILAHPPWQAEQ